MSHWKLTLAYDGAPYRGWQIQPNLPTVQGLLSNAIHRTTGERVLPQGSGRTDAGVHALAQVASFTLNAPIPAANLHRALNRCLPPSVRVLSVEAVPPTFHARHSALRKTYDYRIFPIKSCAPQPGSPASAVARRGGRLDFEMWEENICPPTLAPTVWPCLWPLDLAALNQAAAHVLGTHDFTSFAAADPDLTHRAVAAPDETVIPTEAAHSAIVGRAVEGPPHLLSPAPEPPPPIRTITHSQWRISDNLLIYRVTADGFLHHMVRNLVGTFVQAGAHRLSPASIPALLAARDRAAAGPTAPASGLFLVSVDYPAL